MLAAVGAVTGALCLIAVYANRAHLVIEMDRELPRRIVSGVHPPERAGELTFAWTSQRADFRLRGLNRGSPWTCVVVARGGRGGAAANRCRDRRHHPEAGACPPDLSADRGHRSQPAAARSDPYGNQFRDHRASFGCP
jgi:hypothetical protein